MRGKLLAAVFVAVFFAVLAVMPVHANLQDQLQIKQFQVNGIDLTAAMDEANALDNEVFQRGDSLDIMLNVKNTGNSSLTDLQASAELVGDKYATYRKSDTYDFSKLTRLDAGQSRAFDLKLTIPADMGQVDSGYKLRIRIDDANDFGFSQDYQITLDGVDSSNAVSIDDFSFSPQEVEPGRAFTSLVRVQNLGTDDITDMKVTVSVPDLNIQDTEYQDSSNALSTDDFMKFEQLLLRVPTDAKPGTYKVEITVDFSKYESVTKEGTITIVPEKGIATGNAVSGNEGPSQITVTPAQDILPGSSAVYPILIENDGQNARTYTVMVSGISDWATYTLEPSSVINVDAGSKETVLLTVNANNDVTAGQRAFVLSVENDAGTVQKPLTANVAKASAGKTDWSKIQDGLTIGLIVLVIILIILGLVIGFSKLKGNDKEDTKPQTYY